MANIGFFSGRMTKAFDEITVSTDDKGENYCYITLANNDTKEKPVFITGKIKGKQIEHLSTWLKPKGRILATIHLWQGDKDEKGNAPLRTAFSKVEIIDWKEKGHSAGSAAAAPETDTGAANEPF